MTRYTEEDNDEEEEDCNKAINGVSEQASKNRERGREGR